MKRIFALLLAAVSLISLTACAQPEAKTASKYQLAARSIPRWRRTRTRPSSADPTETLTVTVSIRFITHGRQTAESRRISRRAIRTRWTATSAPSSPAAHRRQRREQGLLPHQHLHGPRYAGRGDRQREPGEQILALLGSGDVNALRAEAAAVWNANYCDDGAVTSILANSLWLSDKISFKQEAMDALARYYYASSFRGEMGSAAFDKALQDWIDQQTGGLLKEQASGLTMDKETILALASTIYFRAKWNGEFSEANTVPDTFHADSGDTTCDFMRQRGTNTYYWSDRFSAVSSRWRAAVPCGSCCRTRALRRRSCWLTSRRWTSYSAAARARKTNTLSSTSLCRSSTRHRTWIWPTA